MRIVTLNTWKNEGDYPRRLELMASGLAELRPDVVCLQECFQTEGFDTAATLAAALSLKAYGRPARRKLRLHGGVLRDSASGLAILTSADVRAEGVLPLPSDPADGDRIAQRLDLAGAPLRILNLHLTHLRGPAAARLRARQLAAALAWARAEALVVAGDLNAAAGDAELAALGPGLVRTAPTMHGPRARAIDHLLLMSGRAWRATTRRLALQHCDAQGVTPSDHMAVVLDLEFLPSTEKNSHV